MPGIKFSCSACGQHLEAPEEAAGCELPCPTCQQPLRVPTEPAVGSDSAQSAVPQGPREVCAICQTRINVDEAKASCPACAAEYHSDCWQENGGCAVYGCSEVPVVESRQSIEIPISYWGQENKPCPSCGREILAAAVRCRHCGATFSSARPEDADEFWERSERNERLPAARRMVIWLFICCVVPCLAPIGLVWGAVWYARHRDDVRALPAMYAALCKIGLGVAAVLVAAIALMALVHAVFTSL